MKKRKITMEGSLQSIKTSCEFCGACVDFGGFDFIDAATKRAVCVKCVKKHAPELLGVPEKVEAYAAMTREMMAAKDGDPISISDAYLSNSESIFFTFTLDFYGFKIRGCECRYTAKGVLCFGHPEAQPGMFSFEDEKRKVILDKLANAVIQERPSRTKVDSDSQMPF
jgi:hypothetical protein